MGCAFLWEGHFFWGRGSFSRGFFWIIFSYGLLGFFSHIFLKWIKIICLHFRTMTSRRSNMWWLGIIGEMRGTMIKHTAYESMDEWRKATVDAIGTSDNTPRQNNSLGMYAYAKQSCIWSNDPSPLFISDLLLALHSILLKSLVCMRGLNLWWTQTSVS